MSKENVVADSWEDADADPVKELMEKVEKVKLLQRKEEKKEAFFEKVKAEENGGSVPKLQAEEGMGPLAEEPKRVFLRRPKDGFAAESVVESSPPSATATESQPISRGRSHHKPSQKDPKQPAPTLEERQAAYQAARNRILGSAYKPDNNEIKEIKFIDRSKSPETLKMTQKNMVEHYGEELSRELMQPPVEHIVPPEMQYVPDFSLQQPPPCMIQPDGTGVYNGPPGFQPIQQNFQPSHRQQQFVENPYYIQMNGQIAMQPPNQSQIQQFVPQESSAISSTSQNSNLDGHNEQTFYYCSPPTQQQMNYMQYNLPNMAYPPPNFPPPGQQNQHIASQMAHAQFLQMQQQISGQMVNQYQVPSEMARGANNSARVTSNSGGVARGQNRPPMMYQMPNNGGTSMKVPPLMYPMQNRGQQSNGQNYSNRNGGNGHGSGQQRQFQQPNQQNGLYIQSHNANQSNANNGRKQPNKNGKTGQRGNDNIVQKNNFVPSQSQISIGQNPIPFGCPPPHVNAIREQYSMPPNTGAGILGPHPMMTASQWPTLQQTRPQ